MTTEQLAITYGLPLDLVECFINLKPGKATGVINQIVGNHPAMTRAEIKLQLDIIQSKLNEAYTSLENNDFNAMRNDAADLLFTSNCLGNRLGAPVDVDYIHVVLSNVAKFDRTEEDAIKTRDKYLEQNIVTKMRKTHIYGYDLIVTVSAFDQVPTEDGKFKFPAGKWLKSYQWVDCQFQGEMRSPLKDPAFDHSQLRISELNELAESLAVIEA